MIKYSVLQYGATVVCTGFTTFQHVNNHYTCLNNSDCIEAALIPALQHSLHRAPPQPVVGLLLITRRCTNR